jgi:hypothetical protein
VHFFLFTISLRGGIDHLPNERMAVSLKIVVRFFMVAVSHLEESALSLALVQRGSKPVQI